MIAHYHDNGLSKLFHLGSDGCTFSWQRLLVLLMLFLAFGALHFVLESTEENIEAIKRQIKALEKSFDDRKQEFAKELNEYFVKKGNLEAIERKIVALSDGGVHPLPFRGYSALFNSVTVPTCGYKKDLVTARELNDQLIEKGNLKAIQKKIKSLLGKARGSYSNFEGSFEINLTYGYEKDPSAAREFIEHLVVCEFPTARGIGKYLKAFAMKYGIVQLGYERDRDQAFKFIKEYHVPY